jgi:membrane associated rhomboid family serine protease
VCGFGGFNGGEPNQWFRYVGLGSNSSVFEVLCFRFITAIFLHAGFIHIILNMIAQLTISAQVGTFLLQFLTLMLPQIEREMGSAGFFITYFAAGIFGYVLTSFISLHTLTYGAETCWAVTLHWLAHLQ